MTIDSALWLLRKALTTGDTPGDDDERTFRTLVRDCLLRLCGRVIEADGMLSRDDVLQWLQDEREHEEVLLATMTLELSSTSKVLSDAPESVHANVIRTVCEAHPFVSVQLGAIRALVDDEHRHRCAGVRRHPVPRVPADPADEIIVDEIAIAPVTSIQPALAATDVDAREAA